MNNLSGIFQKKSEGSVLVIAIMALVVLTLIGIAATSTSNLEVQIAANDVFAKQAFYTSESLLNVTAEILRQFNSSDTHVLPISPSGRITYGLNFAFWAFNDGPFPNPAVDPSLRSNPPDDVTISLSGVQNTVDVCRRETIVEEGSSTEFGAPSVAFAVYDLTAHGNGPQGANYTVQARCQVLIPSLPQ